MVDGEISDVSDSGATNSWNSTSSLDEDYWGLVFDTQVNFDEISFNHGGIFKMVVGLKTKMVKHR